MARSLGTGVAPGAGVLSTGAVEAAGAAGAAGRIAVFGKAGRTPLPAAVNRIATGKARTIATPTAAAAGASRMRWRWRGARLGLEGSIITGAGGGGVGTVACAGGAQSRCREQLAHQLSIATFSAPHQAQRIMPVVFSTLKPLLSVDLIIRSTVSLTYSSSSIRCALRPLFGVTGGAVRLGLCRSRMPAPPGLSPSHSTLV